MAPLPKLAAVPPGVATAVDYRPLARERLDDPAWDYLEAGCGEGVTLAANRAALAVATIMPRPLAAVSGGHTQVRLFDQTFAQPLALAPVAYQRLFHPDGECAAALAAAAQEGLFIVSSLASQPLEAIFAAAPGAWFQLYWQGGRDASLRLLRRAEAAGAAAVVLTVDAPVKQAVLDLPPDIRAVNLEAAAAPRRVPPGGSAVFDGWMAQAPTWDDLAWLREATRLPLLVKGLLHPDDGARAVALGADGVVVSNHGGRVLDGAPAALDALPAMVERLAGRVPVLFDSGVRDGRDAYRALARGAAAVLVGRPYVWGLATAGALGVAHVIRLMRDELEMTMALAGCRRLGATGGA